MRTEPVTKKELYYYRERQKHRLHVELLRLLESLKTEGMKRATLAELLEKDPAQISRWLNGPSNLTLDTISDLLLAMEMELDFEPVSIYGKPNTSDISTDFSWPEAGAHVERLTTESHPNG